MEVKSHDLWKKQETKRLLSNLRSKTPLSQTPLLTILLWVYKMNEVVTIFLLAVDKFMPDMYLKQLDFAYSACGPFAKTKERIETFL